MSIIGRAADGLDESFRKLLEESTDAPSKTKKGVLASPDRRHRKTEQEEDAELLREERHEQSRTIFTESPKCMAFSWMRF